MQLVFKVPQQPIRLFHLFPVDNNTIWLSLCRKWIYNTGERNELHNQKQDKRR